MKQIGDRRCGDGMLNSEQAPDRSCRALGNAIYCGVGLSGCKARSRSSMIALPMSHR